MTAPAITACLSSRGTPKTGYRFGRRMLKAALITARETGMATRWYRCGACGYWHITKQPERGR